MAKSKRQNIASVLAVAAAMLRLEHSSGEIKQIRRSKPMTEEAKNKARGLKYFIMPDGSSIPALNQKTAEKKWHRQQNNK